MERSRTEETGEAPLDPKMEAGAERKYGHLPVTKKTIRRLANENTEESVEEDLEGKVESPKARAIRQVSSVYDAMERRENAKREAWLADGHEQVLSTLDNGLYAIVQQLGGTLETRMRGSRAEKVREKDKQYIERGLRETTTAVETLSDRYHSQRMRAIELTLDMYKASDEMNRFKKVHDAIEDDLVDLGARITAANYDKDEDEIIKLEKERDENMRDQSTMGGKVHEYAGRVHRLDQRIGTVLEQSEETYIELQNAEFVRNSYIEAQAMLPDIAGEEEQQRTDMRPHLRFLSYMDKVRQRMEEVKKNHKVSGTDYGQPQAQTDNEDRLRDILTYQRHSLNDTVDRANESTAKHHRVRSGN